METGFNQLTNNSILSVKTLFAQMMNMTESNELNAEMNSNIGIHLEHNLHSNSNRELYTIHKKMHKKESKSDEKLLGLKKNHIVHGSMAGMAHKVINNSLLAATNKAEIHFWSLWHQKQSFTITPKHSS
jgi:hypothetical protein